MLKLATISICLAVMLLLAVGPAAGQPREWQAERTWVFMVGLLEWEDGESFAAFPKENRRDVTLLNVLKARGVPVGQIVYLQDRSGTTSRIRTEFEKLLRRTRQGDTVMVYLEGHGYKDDNGETFFASYDTDEESNPGVPLSLIPASIERYFKGSTAIIVQDHCYSGTMAELVQKRKSSVSYAVLASSSASQSSTGNWTFTEAVISAFRGDMVSDDDADGSITFAELRANAEADMLFGEEQVAAFAFTGGFDVQTKITKSIPNPGPRIGERVEAYSIDGWYRGYVIGHKDGKYRIHYYGYEDSDDEWVTPKMIRSPKISSQYKIGEKVEVEWKKEWYPAHILNIKGGSHYISYDDSDVDENEWVSSRRIRKRR